MGCFNFTPTCSVLTGQVDDVLDRLWTKGDTYIEHDCLFLSCTKQRWPPFQPHSQQTAAEADAGGAVVTETCSEVGGSGEETIEGQKGQSTCPLSISPSVQSICLSSPSNLSVCPLSELFVSLIWLSVCPTNPSVQSVCPTVQYMSSTHKSIHLSANLFIPSISPTCQSVH